MGEGAGNDAAASGDAGEGAFGDENEGSTGDVASCPREAVGSLQERMGACAGRGVR